MFSSAVPPIRRVSSLGRSLAVGVLLFVGLSLWNATPAHAYAWMIRHDYSACGTCHADPSGGELLTQYGRVTAQLLLASQYGSPDAPSKEATPKSEGSGGASKSAELEGPKPGLFWGAVNLPDALLLSGSYRNLYLLQPSEDQVFTFVPVMQADLYGRLRLGPVTMGGSVGIAKVSPGSEHSLAAQVTHAPAGKVNMISRTHYVGVDLGTEFLMRLGRLNLPFGVRIPEHTAWVRESTRTDRESDQQHGLALSYVGENLRGEVMAIAGNYQTSLTPAGQYADLSRDAVRERGYALYLEGIGSPTFATGISSKVTYARLDRITNEEETVRQAHGMTMRWGPAEEFSILAEMDVLFRSNATAGYVGFTQADYEPWGGLHFLLTGEVVDNGRTNDDPEDVAPGRGNPKFGGWVGVDWFFYKQFELRVDAVFRQTEGPTIMGQLHMYL